MVSMASKVHTHRRTSCLLKTNQKSSRFTTLALIWFKTWSPLTAKQLQQALTTREDGVVSLLRISPLPRQTSIIKLATTYPKVEGANDVKE